MTVTNVGVRHNAGRHHDRQRAGKRANCNVAASIKYNGLLICTCRIRDISDGGLRLSVPSETRLPNEFEIEAEIFEGPVKAYTIWVSDNQVGVSLGVSWPQIRQFLRLGRAA